MRRTTVTVPQIGVDGETDVFDLSAGCDLPCPWCAAATSESDARCPSCDRRFG